MHGTEIFPHNTSCSGFCARCNTVHTLGPGKAVQHCHELMDKLDACGRADFDVPTDQADPEFSTNYLFGKARGQMFGIMTYLDRDKNEKTAKAFSGQYNGHWEIPGWTAPIIDPQEFQSLTETTEREIKRIGREMEKHVPGSPGHAELGSRRKKMSQGLMRKIHAIYTMHNFRAEKLPMPEIIHGQRGIPTGTGDCCAPKLLNFAARNGYTPLGIAEFYYGRENRSATRAHKQFYPSCTDKCGLILGYMLCGL
ncbi:hypothetical protein [Desulfovibrio sp. JC010]|uniref:hypothetical protein n=1 Tax=Desulfovibrio sp. JC010 TaxID=2593641 RepID=UPI0013D41664|nr:hypothetical protein [Desulfovibrio sp. JC010]NDV27445.1 hypothetical protein [Desulfovibrio sp. JC010]